MVHLSGGFAAGFSAPTMSSIQEEFELEDTTKNWFGNYHYYYISGIHYYTIRVGILEYILVWVWA